MRLKNDRQAHMVLVQQVKAQKLLEQKVEKKSIEKWVSRAKIITTLLQK